MFRSKIDAWLALVILAVVLAPAAQAVSAFKAGADWAPPAAIAAILAGFNFWLVISTRYMVREGFIHVRSGPFTWAIAIKKITAIVPSRSLLSSPAFSLDRLRIDYEPGRMSLMISPRDKQAFIEAVEAAKSTA